MSATASHLVVAPHVPTCLADKADTWQLNLRFDLGKALICVTPRHFQGMQLKELVFQIPNLTFPFNLKKGADSFKHAQLHLFAAQMQIDWRNWAQYWQTQALWRRFLLEDVQLQLTADNSIFVSGTANSLAGPVPFSLNIGLQTLADGKLQLVLYRYRVYGALGYSLPQWIDTCLQSLRGFGLWRKQLGIWQLRPWYKLLNYTLAKKGMRIHSAHVGLSVKLSEQSILLATSHAAESFCSDALAGAEAEQVLASDEVEQQLLAASDCLLRHQPKQAFAIYQAIEQAGREGVPAIERTFLQFAAAQAANQFNPSLAWPRYSLVQAQLGSYPSLQRSCLPLACHPQADGISLIEQLLTQKPVALGAALDYSFLLKQNLAYAYRYNLKNNDLAIRCFHDIYKQRPEQYELIWQLACLCYEKKQYIQAAFYAEKYLHGAHETLSDFNSWPEKYVFLSKLWMLCERSDKALPILQKLLAQSENLSDLVCFSGYFLLGKIHANQQNHEQALNHLEQAMAFEHAAQKRNEVVECASLVVAVGEKLGHPPALQMPRQARYAMLAPQSLGAHRAVLDYWRRHQYYQSMYDFYRLRAQLNLSPAATILSTLTAAKILCQFLQKKPQAYELVCGLLSTEGSEKAGFAYVAFVQRHLPAEWRADVLGWRDILQKQIQSCTSRSYQAALQLYLAETYPLESNEFGETIKKILLQVLALQPKNHRAAQKLLDWLPYHIDETKQPEVIASLEKYFKSTHHLSIKAHACCSIADLLVQSATCFSEKSLSYYEKAIEFDRQNQKFWYSKCLYLYSFNQFEQALSGCQQAQAYFGDGLSFHFWELYLVCAKQCPHQVSLLQCFLDFMATAKINRWVDALGQFTEGKQTFFKQWLQYVVKWMEQQKCCESVLQLLPIVDSFSLHDLLPMCVQQCYQQEKYQAMVSIAQVYLKQQYHAQLCDWLLHGLQQQGRLEESLLYLDLKIQHSSGEDLMLCLWDKLRTSHLTQSPKLLSVACELLLIGKIHPCCSMAHAVVGLHHLQTNRYAEAMDSFRDMFACGSEYIFSPTLYVQAAQKAYSLALDLQSEQIQDWQRLLKENVHTQHLILSSIPSCSETLLANQEDLSSWIDLGICMVGGRFHAPEVGVGWAKKLIEAGWQTRSQTQTTQFLEAIEFLLQRDVDAQQRLILHQAQIDVLKASQDWRACGELCFKVARGLQGDAAALLMWAQHLHCVKQLGDETSLQQSVEWFMESSQTYPHWSLHLPFWNIVNDYRLQAQATPFLSLLLRRMVTHFSRFQSLCPVIAESCRMINTRGLGKRKLRELMRLAMRLLAQASSQDEQTMLKRLMYKCGIALTRRYHRQKATQLPSSCQVLEQAWLCGLRFGLQYGRQALAMQAATGLKRIGSQQQVWLQIKTWVLHKQYQVAEGLLIAWLQNDSGDRPEENRRKKLLLAQLYYHNYKLNQAYSMATDATLLYCHRRWFCLLKALRPYCNRLRRRNLTRLLLEYQLRQQVKVALKCRYLETLGTYFAQSCSLQKAKALMYLRHSLQPFVWQEVFLEVWQRFVKHRCHARWLRSRLLWLNMVNEVLGSDVLMLLTEAMSDRLKKIHGEVETAQRQKHLQKILEKVNYLQDVLQISQKAQQLGLTLALTELLTALSVDHTMQLECLHAQKKLLFAQKNYFQAGKVCWQIFCLTPDHSKNLLDMLQVAVACENERLGSLAAHQLVALGHDAAKTDFVRDYLKQQSHRLAPVLA